MLTEHFLWRPELQALSRRVVEPITQGANILIGDVEDDGFRWQVASDTPVGVLDGAFLPGRLRVAEPCRRSHASLQLAP